MGVDILPFSCMIPDWDMDQNDIQPCKDDRNRTEKSEQVFFREGSIKFEICHFKTVNIKVATIKVKVFQI